MAKAFHSRCQTDYGLGQPPQIDSDHNIVRPQRTIGSSRVPFCGVLWQCPALSLSVCLITLQITGAGAGEIECCIFND
jgi:hypothetical protein